MHAHVGSNATPSRYSSHFIEWDDTPSFAYGLDAAPHVDTVPSALLPLLRSTPFCEPLSGLAVREVTDADVFRHFFGR